ncbi:hypothetical protein M426DRAFT_232805 [Hypoxylon sp. CI-4A]|nr:hypothetical protein M426DRAFT_232805 [Hypoxylon sp. CI-4A]
MGPRPRADMRLYAAAGLPPHTNCHYSNPYPWPYPTATASLAPDFENNKNPNDWEYAFSLSQQESQQEPPQCQQNLQHFILPGEEMRMTRKRKAESQDNARLSKRLSLLNLEHNGQKLYVPVESPQLKPTESTSLKHIPEDDTMELDNTKHKVYIYNLDDELSESESDDSSKLVFLPDIEKHLRQNRIPPSVLANKDGEIAGMQLVLYSEPSSLTVPKEQDSVRKAIIEARQRVREKQKEEREQSNTPIQITSSTDTFTNDFQSTNETEADVDYNDDPDAMEVD